MPNLSAAELTGLKTGTSSLEPVFLDDQGFTAVAIDAPHRLRQEHQKPPERDGSVTAFREPIAWAPQFLPGERSRRG
jgi:hypothetical protein